MITQEPARRDIERWRRIYEQNRKRLTPNRVGGTEVERYFVEKYAPQTFLDAAFIQTVEGNLLSNAVHFEKLALGARPDVAAYRLFGDVLVGIDRTTGFFHVEGSDIRRVAEIWDDLFLYRGLDACDLENFVLVAQYVMLRQRSRARKF